MSKKINSPLPSALEIECNWLSDINWHLSKLIRDIGSTAGMVTNEQRLYGDHKYGYIPYDNNPFLRALISIRWKLHRESGRSEGQIPGKPYTGRGTRPNFIDIGCGIGDKLVLANQLDCCAYGLEWNKYLVRYAKRVFGITDSKSIAVKKCLPMIYQMDAINHRYSNYHIIFLNAPYQDSKSEAKLEQRIYYQASLGAFLLMPNYVVPPPKEDYVQGKNFGDDTLFVFRRLSKGGRRLV